MILLAVRWDRGLGKIPPMFCADALVNPVLGSCVSGSACTGDLVWFLIGLPVLGSCLSPC